MNPAISDKEIEDEYLIKLNDEAVDEKFAHEIAQQAVAALFGITLRQVEQALDRLGYCDGEA